MPSYLNVVYDEKVKPLTEYPRQLCSHLVSRFEIVPGAKLLDVGCGRGDFLNGFESCGLDAYGADHDPSGAKFAGDAVVKHADLEKGDFPFADNTFDVVFSKSVIEHLSDPVKFISETRRVIQPGGRIIVMTPDWHSAMKVFFDDYTRRRPYTVTARKSLLDILGFQNTQAELFYQLPVLWRYPWLKIISRCLQLVVPVRSKRSRIKFVRWSVELMVLGTGVK